MEESNWQPLCCESACLTTTPRHHDSSINCCYITGVEMQRIDLFQYLTKNDHVRGHILCLILEIQRSSINSIHDNRRSWFRMKSRTEDNALNGRGCYLEYEPKQFKSNSSLTSGFRFRFPGSPVQRLTTGQIEWPYTLHRIRHGKNTLVENKKRPDSSKAYISHSHKKRNWKKKLNRTYVLDDSRNQDTIRWRSHRGDSTFML